MIESFFTILTLIFSFSIGIYAFFHNKKDLIFLLVLTGSLLTIIRLDWYVSALSLSLLILSILFIKRTSYTQMVTFSMLGSILFSYFLLNFFLYFAVSNLLLIIVCCVVLMCFLAINGIFEDDLEKYLIYSNLIQTLFVLLDLSVARATGKIMKLGTIQIFNYTFAGSLLFLTLGVLSKDNKRKSISKLTGSIYRNKLLSICAIISAVSLAGVPGLNMFVSEWLLFKKSFIISPVITIFGIFLALLLFVMYFKIVYVCMVGKSKVREHSPKVLNWICIGLGIVCLLLGLLPNIQFFILDIFL